MKEKSDWYWFVKGIKFDTRKKSEQRELFYKTLRWLKKLKKQA